jgi:hypothetical protein
MLPRLALASAALLASLLPALGHDAPGEYFFNTDPGLGAATPLSLPTPTPPLDQIDSLVIPAPSTPGASAVLGLRFRDATGAWGPTTFRRVHLVSRPGSPVVEASWGAGFSSGVTGAPAADGTLVLTRPSTTAGDDQPDRLSLRVLPNADAPGPRIFRQVLPVGSIGPDRLYYALDQRPDPATAPWIVLDETHRTTPTALALDLGSATPGYHTLHFRLRDATGTWTESQRFIHLTPSGLQTIAGLAYSFRKAEGTPSAVQVAPLIATGSAQDVTLAVPASLAKGDYTLVLNLADTSANLGFSVESSISLAARYQQWALTALAGVPAEQAGMLGDPDSDNLANLLEYAFGLNPRTADSTPLYSIKPHPSYSDILIVRYPQREGGSGTLGADYTADGLRYTVEVSTDLQTWTPYNQIAGLSSSIVTDSLGTGFESVTITLNTHGVLALEKRVFTRLNITAVP